MSFLDPNRPQNHLLFYKTGLPPVCQLFVEVVFGAPGKACNGAGICNIVPVEPVRVHWKCPHARALLSCSPEGVLSLKFEQDALSHEVIHRYFRGQEFWVEEAYPLPKRLLSRLNLAPLTIAIGRYAVQVSDSFFVLNL